MALLLQYDNTSESGHRRRRRLGRKVLFSCLPAENVLYENLSDVPRINPWMYGSTLRYQVTRNTSGKSSQESIKP